MPTALIVVFLLFFAVLAFAWFYLQRAKARTVTAAESTDAAVATSEPAAATPVGSTYAAPAEAGHDHAEHDDHTDHSH